MSHHMHCILLWTSYFRSIQFCCLLSLLYIFQFLSVLLIVTDLLSVSCFKSCKFGQFFGTGTNRWCLGENNVYQNGEWRFYVSWIGSCYVTSNVSYLLCEIWGTHIGVAEDSSPLGCGTCPWVSGSQHFEGSQGLYLQGPTDCCSG